MRAVSLLVVVAACGSSSASAIDAGRDAQLRDAPTTCVARATTIAPGHVHATPATTFAGTSCVIAGCHLAPSVGQGAPAFQFAGTVFGDDGVTPNQGVTVRILPFTSDGASAVTDSAGNFFIADGTLPDPFPGRAQATVCPTVNAMPDELVNGDCNNPGCHAAAGLMPIRLMPVM